MTYKRFIDAVIITVGLLLFLISLTGGEPIGVVLGLFVAVLGIVSLIPKQRNRTPDSGD
ncbi:hypothetical protein IRT45_34895 [Nocardia sp. BSTN01]|uniref:hypothetical protein n=1 Tax=Nocardia sp. BSTN01 TaxID=2783665 RepID=UPI00188ED500|nr:hypothetical protein [Nocardia sp. BSTN01]MBF5002308.1 hypothetical protein [Nocardia sp. BSTN01]